MEANAYFAYTITCGGQPMDKSVTLERWNDLTGNPNQKPGIGCTQQQSSPPTAPSLAHCFSDVLLLRITSFEALKILSGDSHIYRIVVYVAKMSSTGRWWCTSQSVCVKFERACTVNILIGWLVFARCSAWIWLAGTPPTPNAAHLCDIYQNLLSKS